MVHLAIEIIAELAIATIALLEFYEDLEAKTLENKKKSDKKNKGE